MAELGLLHSYLEGNSSYEYTFKRLSSSEAMGKVWAGEIAIDKAYHDLNPDYLMQAIDVFDGVLNRFSPNKANLEALTRAAVRKIHLPIDALIIQEESFPPINLAKSVYNKTIEVANSFQEQANQIIRSEPTSKIAQGCKGLIGELAVLSLLERTSIKEIGPECWYPMWARLSQDRKNRHGSSVDKAWDISLLTDIKGVDEPEERLQIKTAHHRMADRQRSCDITLVEVDPMLRIHPSDRNIGNLILNEMYKETYAPNSSICATPNLNLRANQLLDLLG